MPYFKNAKVSASFGKIENENSDECEFLPFDKQYLRQKFRIYSTDNLGITPCIGNSMSPTINEGDNVIFQKN